MNYSKRELIKTEGNVFEEERANVGGGGVEEEGRWV